MLAAAQQPRTTTGRILVVDDDRQIGLICAKALALDKHVVETTTNPVTALRLLERASHYLCTPIATS